jgi:hypothetical protein
MVWRLEPVDHQSDGPLLEPCLHPDSGTTLANPFPGVLTCSRAPTTGRNMR